MFSSLRRRDEGASMLEFALILPVLFLILIGLAEFGLGFRNMLGVNSASREGARVASAMGDDVFADCVAIEATAAGLAGVNVEKIQQVWIYKAADDGTPIPGIRQVFRPAITSDPAASLVCSDGWVQLENGYPPSSRSIVSANLDLVGVRIIFTHDWATGFPPMFDGSETWTADTIMRLEPQIL